MTAKLVKGINSVRISTIRDVLQRCGAKQYQIEEAIKQVYQNNRVTCYSQISVIKKDARHKLIDAFGGRDEILTVKPVDLSESDQCVKTLFQLRDPLSNEFDGKRTVEAVFMKFQQQKSSQSTYGHTSLCLSSQVGCALKCAFCATGASGFNSQMTTDQIVDQFLFFRKHGAQYSNISQNRDDAVGTVSFMGQGEPFMNPRTFDALRCLIEYCGMASRRINVSTVGVIPGIVRLTDEFPQVNLAFSLHNPFPGEERARLVPTERMYPLPEVMKALERHALISKRKIMLAYLLLPGINSSPDHAKKIADWIENMDPTVQHLFHLNILRYNPAFGIQGNDFQRTSESDINRFVSSLGRKISYTVRQSFGIEVDAACGQLFNTGKAQKNLME
ncbi:hypothetical protein MIR68_006227 [Amoeboaphelidium protococcarum]|nr:hypothetical protein MIR68_006227 [Amoeboaphelidium protococcarum]